MANLLCITGWTAAAVGLWMIHPSLALVSGGAFLVSFGVFLHKTKDKK